MTSKTVLHGDGTLVPADSVKVEIHHTQPCDSVYQLNSPQRVVLEPRLLLLIELIVGCVGDEIVSREQKAASTGRRIADCDARLRAHHIDNGFDQRPRREILARAALHVFGVLLKQSFVSVALHIGFKRHPLLAVDQVGDQTTQLGGILNLVLRLAKDDPQETLLFTESLKQVSIMNLQLIAVAFEQALPVVTLRYRVQLIEWRPGLLVGHLEEQKVGELLDVVSVRQAIVSEYVAVVPHLLNDLL